MSKRRPIKRLVSQASFWWQVRKHRLFKAGIRWRRRRLGRAAQDFPKTADAIGALKELSTRAHSLQFEPERHDDEAPIFILATGWRTGSTLLQRICMSDPKALVYGEPLGRASIIPRLTAALASVTTSFPRPNWELGQVEWDFLTSFPANLYPPLADLREAMREMFLRWLAVPARERGYEHWGVKEVRLSAGDACLVRWLFPKAKLLVLTRHPNAVFASSRDFNYWYRWPDLPVDGGMGVVEHWNRIAESWAELPHDWGHRLIRYEELTSGEFDFRELERYLGIELNEDQALGAVTGGSRGKKSLTFKERAAILGVARAGMKVMGYPTAI